MACCFSLGKLIASSILVLIHLARFCCYGPNSPLFSDCSNYFTTNTLTTSQSTAILLLSTAEVLALIRSRLPVKIPRLHPIALIIADLLAVSLLIWSFLVLFLEVYDFRQGKSSVNLDLERKGDGEVVVGEYGREADLFCGVEIWIAVGLGSAALLSSPSLYALRE